MSPQEQFERLQALAEIQTADIASLLALVEQLATFVRESRRDIPDLGAEFLRLRKVQLQQRLEELETRNPVLAARFQYLIDQSCTIFPPTYE